MSVKTKEQLKQDFSDNQTATGAKFSDLIDSLKAVQSAVSDPAASGTSVTFIATISQDTNGEITVTKKTVDFSEYQTVSDMNNYQVYDVQEVGPVNVDESGSDIVTNIVHNKKHFPTVRILDDKWMEIPMYIGTDMQYSVTHISEDEVEITLAGSLNIKDAVYNYILD